MKKGSERRNSWPPIKIELDRRRWHYQRIEDKLTPGIPDLNIHVPGVGDVWMELKHVDALPRYENGNIDIGLRPEQFIWLRDAKKSGRNVLLTARVGRDWYCWRDVGAWELAKHPNPWNILRKTAHRFLDVNSLIGSLQWEKRLGAALEGTLRGPEA
jgi:hypothetical protein